MPGAACLSLPRLALALAIALAPALAAALHPDDGTALLQTQQVATGSRQPAEQRGGTAADGQACMGSTSGHDCDSCAVLDLDPGGRRLGPPSPATAPKASRVAIFAQVFNHSLWGEIRQCISNVGQARGERTVDVYVAVVRGNATISEQLQGLQDRGLVSQASVQLVQNTGADIGQFMQQVTHVQGLHKEYDVMLKMHSKTGNLWRVSMLGSLCGSPDQVAKIWQRFDDNQKLGIVGPPAWTWTYESDYKQALRSYLLGGVQEEEQKKEKKQKKWVPPAKMQNWMRVAWGVIFPCETVGAFPDPKEFALLAGSTYWSRAYPLLQNEAFASSIPKFLGMFGEGYHTGCDTPGCHHMFALERVIPTMIKARYRLEVELAPDNKPPEGWLPKTTDHVGGHAWKSGDEAGAPAAEPAPA